MLKTWQQTSLKIQLTTITVLLISIGILSTGIATTIFLETYLTKETDNTLQTNAETIIARQLRNMPIPSPYYIKILDPQNKNTLTESQPNEDTTELYNLNQTPPNITTKLIEQLQTKNQKFFTTPSTNGESKWRATIIQPNNYENPKYIFIVALPINHITQTLHSLKILFTIIGCLTTLAATIVAYLAVNKTFKPLKKIKSTAASIAAGDLTQRLEVKNSKTELGRLSSSLNAMLNHIENAFKIRTNSENKMRRFISDASHELRTPLVTIRGFAELYRQGALTNKTQTTEAMQRIEHEAIRMGKLVEDLLNLTRLDEKKPLELTHIDLATIANDTILDTKAHTKRKIKLTSINKNTPQYAPVYADEGKLQQVFVNLITNAIRYTPENTPIEIAVGNINKQTSTFEIRDHGQGIPPEERNKIFERFYRYDDSRTRETGGSGLGLAIVAAIVEAHKGKITIHNTPNSTGATFKVELPFIELPQNQNTTDSHLLP